MRSITGSLAVRKSHLNLKMMLEGGQSFRWKPVNDDCWIGVVGKIVWKLSQTSDTLFYTAYTDDIDCMKQDKYNRQNLKLKDMIDDEKCSEILSEYLRVGAPLPSYYQDWSLKDPNFKKAAEVFCGIRILQQDPVENLFSFICSSNNNIPRISSMVEKLCRLYGNEIGEVDGTVHHSFPEIEALAVDSVESELREAGFGYRAKFIYKSADQLIQLGGRSWLEEQKSRAYEEAKSNLMKLQGIGAKVADCICLMSLNHLEAVPVDTHVFQIATMNYLPGLKGVKTVTDRVYNEIGNFFRELYGPLAGWAHTILFCADLKKFKINNVGTNENPDEFSGKKNKGKRKKVANDVKIAQDDESPTKRKSLRRGKSTDSSSVNDTILRDSNQNFLKTVSGALPCSRQDLYLRVTFNCGQTYRWKQIGTDVWRGVFAERVWTLSQRENEIEYSVTWSYGEEAGKEQDEDEAECRSLIEDYFRLGEPLIQYYQEWSSRDPHFKEISSSFCGLRMTKQDIVENLFAFICSSNNTIKRITGMVEWLCKTYGSKICTLDGTDYFSFPSVYKLTEEGIEAKMQAASFGFRAKYVSEAAKYIVKNGGKEWFKNLENMDYPTAKRELTKLPGIGVKVADCICLTALNHLNTIPVDTHVFQIAKKYYLPHLTGKRVDVNKNYNEIGDHFRNIFGHYAGWAHTVLFCSDLKTNESMI